MTTGWYIDALKDVIEKYGKPKNFNTGQGSQFTSNVLIIELKQNEMKISMDGKGRAIDTLFVERLWRRVK